MAKFWPLHHYNQCTLRFKKIGRMYLNEIFVFFLVQYVEFVSDAANIYDVTAAIGA